MKNILLATILLSTIACNGSGGGPIKVDPETNQVVETINHYTHEPCVEQDTPTLRVECYSLGVKPIEGAWIATPNNATLPAFEKDINGNIVSNGTLNVGFFDYKTGKFEIWTSYYNVNNPQTFVTAWFTSYNKAFIIKGDIIRLSDGSIELRGTHVEGLSTDGNTDTSEGTRELEENAAIWILE